MVISYYCKAQKQLSFVMERATHTQDIIFETLFVTLIVVSEFPSHFWSTLSGQCIPMYGTVI